MWAQVSVFDVPGLHCDTAKHYKSRQGIRNDCTVVRLHRDTFATTQWRSRVHVTGVGAKSSLHALGQWRRMYL